MKRLVFAIAILVSGCGLFKKSTVDIKKTHSEEKTEVVKKVDSTGTKTDRSIIVEKTKIDTAIKTPEVKINTEKKASTADLVRGLTLVDTGLVSVKIKYDSLSKSLKTSVVLKPQTIPVKADKTKTTFVNTSEQSKKETSSNDKHSTVIDDKEKHKTKEPDKMGVLAGIIIAVVLVIGVGLMWFFRKAKPS